jgi:hypothetical protein
LPSAVGRFVADLDEREIARLVRAMTLPSSVRRRSTANLVGAVDDVVVGEM